MKKTHSKHAEGKPVVPTPRGKATTSRRKSATANSNARKWLKSAPKERILIVEDDPQSLEVYSALLTEAGYLVDKADHALAAICAVVRAVPDLILADIGMPIIDGRELVRELKSHKRFEAYSNRRHHRV